MFVIECQGLRSAGSSTVSVCVDTRFDAERKRRETRSVPQGQPVEHRDAEPAEAVLEHVLQRLRARRGGVLVPVATGKLSDDDAAYAFELADLLEVEQRPVDPDRSAADLLEEEDRAVEVGLPRGTDRVDEVDETAADQATLARPSPIEITVRRSRSSGTAPVVSPASTCRNRSAVNGDGEGVPNIVRLGP
jgi:hypothetical protein